MSLSEVKDIANTLDNIAVLLSKMEKQFNALDFSNNKTTSSITDALRRLNNMILNWQEQWSAAMINNVDLGTVTVYEGSIFKPQSIPVTQLLHSVLSDVHQILADIEGILPENIHTKVLEKVTNIILISSYLYEMKSKGQLRHCVFPCDQDKETLKDINQSLLSYQELQICCQ